MNQVRVTVECISGNAVIDSVMRTIEVNSKRPQDEAIAEAIGSAVFFLIRPEHRDKAVESLVKVCK